MFILSNKIDMSTKVDNILKWMLGILISWRKMIHLFAGGRSVLDTDFASLEGLKVFINFAWKKVPNEFIDILIWGDYFVGDFLKEDFNEKPSFKLVCLRGANGKARGWIDAAYEYPQYNFTLPWAILWLREQYSEEKILIHGLDGDGYDYYDGWNKTNVLFPDKPFDQVLSAIQRCYLQLDKLDKTNLYVQPGSAYKGFPEWQ